MGTLEVIHVGILLKPAAPVQREFMRMLNAKKRFSSTLSLSWSAPESQAIVNQRGLFWFNFYMFSTCLLTTRSCENSVDLSFCSFYPGDDFLFPFFYIQCTTNLHFIGLYHLSAAASVCHIFVHMQCVQFSIYFFISTHRKRWR